MSVSEVTRRGRVADAAALVLLFSVAAGREDDPVEGGDPNPADAVSEAGDFCADGADFPFRRVLLALTDAFEVAGCAAGSFLRSTPNELSYEACLFRRYAP